MSSSSSSSSNAVAVSSTTCINKKATAEEHHRTNDERNQFMDDNDSPRNDNNNATTTTTTSATHTNINSMALFGSPMRRRGSQLSTTSGSNSSSVVGGGNNSTSSSIGNTTTATTTTTTTTTPIIVRHHHKQKARWSEAIHAVMRQHHQNHQQQQLLQEYDGLGSAMQRILNQRPEFRYTDTDITTAGTTDSNETTKGTRCDDSSSNNFSYPPILSRHNARVVQHYWHTFRQTHDDNVWNMLRSILQQCQPSPSTLRSAAIFLVVCIIMVGIVSGYVTVYVVQGLWYLAGMGVAFLIDWSDIVPAWVETTAAYVWNVIDVKVLRGRNHQFREWTTDGEFVPSTRTTTTSGGGSRGGGSRGSWTHNLWELPPPTIKQGGKRLALDAQYLQRPEWSDDTVQHVLAIDFCYIMLREHALMNQSAKQRRSKSFSRSSSSSVAAEPAVVVSHARQASEVVEAIELEVSGSCEGEDPDVMDILLPQYNDRNVPWNYHYDSNHDHPLGPDRSCDTSVNSSNSDAVSELPWLDVGAKIGMRLLNSAHVHRAVASQETTERLMASSKDLLILDNPPSSSTSLTHARTDREPTLHEIVLPSLQVAGGSAAPGVMKRKPVHPLWTSPSAAAAFANTQEDNGSIWSLSPPSTPRRTSLDRPPLSPPSAAAATTTATKRSLPRRYSDEDLLSRTERKVLTPPGRTIAEMRRRRIRQPLSPGVRVAVPITPWQPGLTRSNKGINMQYQMGSVVRSERVWVRDLEHSTSLTPNCLSVTVKLERSFLRNGEFADLTFRVMDHWPDRFMPKHSKVPIGSTVATSFGIGVLIGWRVEDDCHIVRSLWRRRGACAYLNRSSIHSVVEAAVGFCAQTRFGAGQVLGYVNGGPRFEEGRFLVHIQDETTGNQVLELNRKDVYSCNGAQFIPVIEHIREAAHFQMQLDMYRESLTPEHDNAIPASPRTSSQSETFTTLSEIVWTSFCKAVDEDKDFDQGVNEFMTNIIEFLERLDGSSVTNNEDDATSVVSNEFEVECVAANAAEQIKEETPVQEPGFWFTNDILGGVFGTALTANTDNIQTSEDRSSVGAALLPSPTQIDTEARSKHFDRVHAFLRTLLKTVSYARVACVDKTHFRLGLAITYDVLLFIRTIVKVQQKNVSIQSLRVWRRAFEEIWSTIEPIKDRLQRIGKGIAQRMEQQGKRAKTKVIKFVDTVLGDERLLIALEQGDWDRCVKQLEAALIQSRILERENLMYYRKTLTFLYNHVRLTLSNNQGAARRNSEKIAILAKVIQWVAAPKRSLLKLFERDDILDIFERILVRVFQKEELASRKVMIHALNFHSLRHLRMLKDFSTSGRLWIPVLDAADEEFSWMVSHLPQSTKDIMSPIASLFSLCVAQFHHIADGDLTKDWMDFLLQEDAIRIIHDIDMKLILALESLSRDVKEMMVVLPYYSNIDDDILNLMDEVDLDEFLREASYAMDDPEKLTHFIREKATIAVQRFLDWLPRISIPVEKRDLIDGWVITCRGEDGGDLTLSDVSVKKENLVCQIMGGDALFFPMFGDESEEDVLLSDDVLVKSPRNKVSSTVIEESVLDHIREMLLQAQRFGCWEAGVGGVGKPPTDRYVASVLHGLPVSSVLNCAIEMWRNLEIDDDELLEIAIKDVSYQIQLQKMREEENKDGTAGDKDEEKELVPPSFSGSSVEVRITESPSMDTARLRFNPRVDPTVLLFDMKNLTLRLDNFMFRIEKNENRTFLDPIFEGKGSLTIQNVSIRVRIECAKERIHKTALGETFSPVLILKELTTSLEQVKLRVRDTAFGSDWLVNKAVHAFSDDITKVVEENLREQVEQQAKAVLENLNSYFLVNPTMLLDLLGISMEDLDDNVIWV